MKKKHEEFAEIELFPEIFSEEKLEEEKKNVLPYVKHSLKHLPWMTWILN